MGHYHSRHWNLWTYLWINATEKTKPFNIGKTTLPPISLFSLEPHLLLACPSHSSGYFLFKDRLQDMEMGSLDSSHSSISFTNYYTVMDTIQNKTSNFFCDGWKCFCMVLFASEEPKSKHVCWGSFLVVFLRKEEYINRVMLESDVELCGTNHWSKPRGGFLMAPNYATKYMTTDHNRHNNIILLFLFIINICLSLTNS